MKRTCETSVSRERFADARWQTMTILLNVPVVPELSFMTSRFFEGIVPARADAP